MRKNLTVFFLSLFCYVSPVLGAEEFFEEAGEYYKIEVKYSGKTSGVIWAYECDDCTPRRFVFDDRTIVELSLFDSQFGVEYLKNVDGLPALVTWIPNTTQVLRVLPMGF